MPNPSVEQSVLHTLGYMALFSYPLTKEEVYRYLWSSCSYNKDEVYTALDRLVQEKQILQKQGMYALEHIDTSIALRQEKIWHTKKRIQKAQNACKILQFIPFVDAVFVCNQLPITVHKKSDIDVFIVIKHPYLWLGRLFVTLVLSAFGLRRHNHHIENHICLSFYISEAALNLSTIAIEDDIYLHYWIATLMPLYDPDNIREKMYKDNSWIHKKLPHAYLPYEIDHRYQVSPWILAKGIKRLREVLLHNRFGKWLNERAKKMQMKKMEKNRESNAQKEGNDVIISDTMLKFHENDRRAQYRDQWKNITASYVSS